MTPFFFHSETLCGETPTRRANADAFPATASSARSTPTEEPAVCREELRVVLLVISFKRRLKELQPNFNLELEFSQAILETLAG